MRSKRQLSAWFAPSQVWLCLRFKTATACIFKKSYVCLDSTGSRSTPLNDAVAAAVGLTIGRGRIFNQFPLLRILTVRRSCEQPGVYGLHRRAPPEIGQSPRAPIRRRDKAGPGRHPVRFARPHADHPHRAAGAAPLQKIQAARRKPSGEPCSPERGYGRQSSPTPSGMRDKPRITPGGRWRRRSPPC